MILIYNIFPLYKTLSFLIEKKSYNYKTLNGTLRTLELEKVQIPMDTCNSYMQLNSN